MHLPGSSSSTAGTRVAYVGGGWATNMGNAYYNLGVLQALRRVYGTERVFLVPDVATWIWDVRGNFEPLHHLDVDLCLFSGPTLAHGMEHRYRRAFDALTGRGARIGFVSAGAAAYSEEERDEVVAFLNRYGDAVACLATRDSDTYELYRKHLSCPVHDGICGSMFLDEAVRIPDLAGDPYVVFNFPRAREPRLRWLADGSVKVCPRRLPVRFQRRMGDLRVVRTKSAAFVRDPRQVFDRETMFFSDIPIGFLTVYKNARYVFSERVHTCAATLVLGSAAMYIPVTDRSRDNRRSLFQRIGVPDIYERPVRLDRELIDREKDKLLRFLQENVP